MNELPENRNKTAGKDELTKPPSSSDMADLMMKLAAIRADVESGDNADRRLKKNVAALLVFILLLLVLPLLFDGSCRPR